MTRRAVVVTDRTIVPAHRGNRVRILGVLRGLRASGWRVSLVCLPQAGSDDELLGEVDEIVRVRARAFDGGQVSRFDSRPFRWAVDRLVARRCPDVVIAEYAWLAPTLARLPRPVRRAVDCHDVLHERTERFTSAGLDPWVRCTRREEIDLLRNADLLIAGQHHDQETLAAILPGKDVACVLPEVDLDPQPRSSVDPAGARVLVVGAGHAGNDGIGRFAGTAWPAVLTAVPGASLDVVGSVPPPRPTPESQVRYVGEVDDLDGWYRSAAMVVCPVEVGTGVKIKMIEALRHGRAVVATPAAVEGLPEDDSRAWLEAPDLDGCAAAVAHLLVRPDERAGLERGATAYAETYLMPATIRRSLVSALVGSRSPRRRLGSLALR